MRSIKNARARGTSSNARHGRRIVSSQSNCAFLKYGSERAILKSRLLFRQPVEFKIKFLYCNDLILNITELKNGRAVFLLSARRLSYLIISDAITRYES